MEAVSFKEKSYNADNKKYKYSSVVLCFLFLFTFILLSISIYSPAAYKKFNHFNTYITTIVYFMTLFFTAKVYKSATKDERKILRWLAWINIGLYLNGTAFFFLVYLHDIRLFNADFLIYQTQSMPVLVFSDYELLGKTKTGLEVLEKLQIGNNAILATSHYENPDIVNRYQSLGIRFLPKNLLAHILIKLTS